LLPKRLLKKGWESVFIKLYFCIDPITIFFSHQTIPHILQQTSAHVYVQLCSDVAWCRGPSLSHNCLAICFTYIFSLHDTEMHKTAHRWSPKNALPRKWGYGGIQPRL